MISQSIPKWIQTIRISLAMYTAYRANFFISVLAPSIVFFFVKYNLWATIYGKEGSGSTIKGYNFEQMIEYHVWAMVVALIGQGYVASNLSEDIRLGKISTYLIYPFDFWEFHVSGWISYQILQTSVATVTLIVIMMVGIATPPSLTALASGFALCLVASMFWFSIQFLTGLMAFWLDETWILRVLISFAVAFLSGSFIPLELYPTWLTTALEYTPFPYMVFYPIKVFMGKAPLELHAILMLLTWTCILIFGNRIAWKKGLGRYTGAGM